MIATSREVDKHVLEECGMPHIVEKLKAIHQVLYDPICLSDRKLQYF